MLVSASAGPEANTEPLGVKQQVWISSVSHCKRRRMEKISVTRRERLLSTLRAATQFGLFLSDTEAKIEQVNWRQALLPRSVSLPNRPAILSDEIRISYRATNRMARADSPSDRLVG